MIEAIHADLRNQAHYQIEAMCFALRRAAKSQDNDALPYLVQSLVIRIEELNNAMMNTVGSEEPELVKDLRRAVYGTDNVVEVAHG